jgi:hypothetical protein
MFGLGLAKYGGIAVGIILLVAAGYLYFAWSQSRIVSLAAELATVQQRAIAIEQQAQVLRDDMERVRVALDDTNRRITSIRARAADNARMVRTSGVTATRDPVEATARANSTMNDAFRTIEEVTRNAR